MKNKWTETGVNVCERSVRKQLEEMGFPSRKAKHNPSLTAKEKTGDGWMKSDIKR